MSSHILPTDTLSSICEVWSAPPMESESEKRQNDDIKSTSANRHGNQQELTDGLEGLTISTRTYRHNVTDGNARAHYGDQHNHYYAGRSGGHDTEPSPKDPMQQLLGSLSFPRRTSDSQLSSLPTNRLASGSLRHQSMPDGAIQISATSTMELYG